MDDYQKEMEANYPAFKKHIYAQLRAEFERTLEPIPGDDLEAYAKAQGAVPLEDFIHEFESSDS
jgi:hypothetical protein